MRFAFWVAALAVVAPPLCAADIPDLGGTWVLNLRKSHFGDVRKPVSVVVSVLHNQLSVSYSGMVVYENEDSRNFNFTGTLDGNEYACSTGFGNGKMSFRRTGFDSIASQFHSDDGQYSGTARMIISRDGSTMTRYMRVRGPSGEQSWVEIYERR